MSTLSYRDIGVPEDWVTDVRTYYSDTPQFNELIEGNQWSDEKITLATQLYISNFNEMPPKLPKQHQSVDSFPSPLVLIHGVGIELLTMAGILESRNYLSYQDANVPVQIHDKAQDYQQWIQRLVSENRQAAKDLKIAQNAEDAFSFKHSPEHAVPWQGA